MNSYLLNESKQNLDQNRKEGGEKEKEREKEISISRLLYGP